MVDIGLIAEASLRAVASMFVVLVVGITFAYHKKIDQRGLTSLGVSTSFLFVPAILFYSFGKGLSVELFRSGAWTLVLLGFVTIPISALVAYPFMRLSNSPVWFERWFVFGATFQNTLALPLILVQTICTQLEFPDLDLVSNSTVTYYMDTSKCIEKAQTYLFLYVFINGLAFWVIAYDVMPSKYDRPPPEADAVVMVTPNEDAESTTSGGEDTPASITEGKTSWRQGARHLAVHVLELCLRPPIIAQLLGTLVGMVPALQDAFFQPTSFLSPLTVCFKVFAEASTAITNFSMAAGLGLKIFELETPRHLFGGSPDGLSVRATWTFVLARMIVIPGVLFAIIYAAQELGWFPPDRLLLVTSYLVSAMPSANMCVVVPQILGNQRASGALGLLVLSQYLVALPSLLLWLSLAFYLTTPPV